MSRLSDSVGTATTLTVHGMEVIGGLLFAQGNRTEAEQVWRAVLRIDKQSYPAHYNLAVSAEYDQRGRRYAGDFDAAVALKRYEAALAVAPGNEERAACLDNMGVLHVKLGDLDRARELFTSAVRLHPDFASGRLNLATVSEESTARDMLTRLVGGPLDSVARLNLAVMLLDVDAAEAARMVEGIDGDSVDPALDGYSVLARVALAIGDLQEARKHAERRLERFEDRADAHALLAVVAMAQQDAPTAVAALETCIALDPDDVHAHVRLGRFLRHLPGATARRRARDHLRETVARWPDDAEAQLLYGLACLGDMPATAGVAFKRALSVDPGYIEARFNLGYLAEDEGTRTGRHRAGDLAAIEHYRQALDIDPDYLPALTNLGTCLLRIGRATEAIPVLDRATAIEPVNPAAIANLGSALAKCGRIEEARSCFMRLLEIDPQNPYARGNLAGLSGVAMPHNLPTR